MCARAMVERGAGRSVHRVAAHVMDPGADRVGGCRPVILPALAALAAAFFIPGFAAGASADRIVTLAPFLTELVFDAGAGNRLVGISAFSDFPAAARALPVVADAAAVNRELLLALRADTVLAWKGGTSAKSIELLQQVGVRTVVLDGDRLDDIPRLLREIGVLAGTQASANAAAEEFSARLAQLRATYSGRTKLRALLEIWHRPLMSISGKHFISDALAICGASNVFAADADIAPTVSLESVFVADPDVIVGAGSAADEKEFRENWAGLRALAAVRKGALVFVDADHIQRQTPRIAAGIADLCAGLDRVRSAAGQSRPSTGSAR